MSDLQTKSFLLAKTFLNSPVTVRRIAIKRDSNIIPTKHIILTFNKPKLPTTVKAGYLNCKIRPYIPNPLRCFKCQRFGHSQTACRGQLTCSRCASVGHASSDCTLEQKCVNCSQPHSADSKLCLKWKIEKEIQTIKTNRNISYIEARKFITPQPSQTYAQVAKSITVNSSSQTDETITKIVCPPLKLLQPLITISKPNMSPSVPAVIKSSTSTQAELVPSTSSVTVASPSKKSQPPNSVIACSVLETTTTTSNTIPTISQDTTQTSKPRRKKRPPKNQSNTIKPKIEIKTAPHRSRKPAPTEYSTDEEDMIVYDVEDEPELTPKYNISEHSNAPEIPLCVKRNSRSRRKRPKVQKAEIEIKMAPHRPRKSAPTDLTTDDEDMITYDVEEEELEPDPAGKFPIKEDPLNFPKGYLRSQNWLLRHKTLNSLTHPVSQLVRRPVRRKRVSWEYLWPTLRCRREAGVSPLLSIGWWYLSSVSPKRHCCRVSAADKGWRVYPLDPRPDAVALYSGCTPDSPLTVSPPRTLNSCRGVISEPDLLCASETEILEGLSDQGVTQVSAMPGFCQMTGTLPPLLDSVELGSCAKKINNQSINQLDSVVGGGTPGRRSLRVHMDPMLLCQGGEPKSVKRLRSGDLLIETTSALQTKFFLLAKSFLNNPVTVTPHKSLNSCRGVISELDLLGTPDSEILEGFSDQGVTQVSRITIKKDSTIVPTKHLILTFNSPKLPNTIKAGYLNCKIRPYIYRTLCAVSNARGSVTPKLPAAAN
ncbi:uncharacterized protein TNCV_1147791 [Trichonephila clavipes]|nr:uncharacterized protein TNCV_1147791 [Trichonephila clavipes]